MMLSLCCLEGRVGGCRVNSLTSDQSLGEVMGLFKSLSPVLFLVMCILGRCFESGEVEVFGVDKLVWMDCVGSWCKLKCLREALSGLIPVTSIILTLALSLSIPPGQG